jgi:hypothetical protein
MATNPIPWARKKLISVLTGYDYQSDEIDHEERVSGQCYCYRVGTDDRLWVHRANPGDRWFGINKATLNTFIDWPTTNDWSGTYYKDGYTLKHILVVASNEDLIARLKGASTETDISQLNWYAFPDDDLPKLSTDKRGAADQFYIKLEGNLAKEFGPYRQDGRGCLPSIEGRSV